MKKLFILLILSIAPALSAHANENLQVGDKVLAKCAASLMEGHILGMTKNAISVQFDDKIANQTCGDKAYMKSTVSPLIDVDSIDTNDWFFRKRFTIGQIVNSIDDGHYSITNNKIYVIRRISKSGFVQVESINREMGQSDEFRREYIWLPITLITD